MDSEDNEFETLHSTSFGSRFRTLNVSLAGGVGGPGGTSGQHSGTGGNGEGGRLYISSGQAVINVREQGITDMIADGLTRSRDQDSQDDFICDLEVKIMQIFHASRGELYLYRIDYSVPRNRFSLPAFSVPRNRYSVRIVRSAKIDVKKVTVANYEGKNAEKASPIRWVESCFEWKEDVKIYMKFRHQRLLQLYGTVQWRDICAAVFHDVISVDFIPYKKFLKIYQHSAISICYIHSYLHKILTCQDLRQARDLMVSTVAQSVDKFLRRNRDGDYDDDESFYFPEMYHIIGFQRVNPDRAILINSSNGRLSVDLAVAGRWDELLGTADRKILSSKDFSYIAKTMSLSLNHYHMWIKGYLSKDTSYTVIPPTATVHLGGIYCLANNKSLAVVAALQHHPSDDFKSLRHAPWPRMVEFAYRGTPTCGGWMRFSNWSNDRINYLSYDLKTSTAWLSQANHIFGRLHCKSDFRKYVFVEEIWFTVLLGERRFRAELGGFLFLCPKEDLVSGLGSFKWPPPERCYHWSLSPTGVPQSPGVRESEQAFEHVAADDDEECFPFGWMT
ncbi:hypothetical protein R3P38DRAFT_2808091 [Favolaschia claudopus]|uniref:Uncharacterized protein n=1 Tax=Favolaschia claudopus TaxID=2862362 RepID=A0AAV9ZHS3_9AGAR